MIDELKELNEKFFQLYARLDRYIEKLSDAQVTSMQEKILAQYEQEYKLLSLSCDIETKREIERLKSLQEQLVPTKWRTKFFKRKRQNYAQTLVDEEVALEAQEFYEKCERELAARYPAQEPTSGTTSEEDPKYSEESAEAEPPVQDVTGRSDETANSDGMGQNHAEKQPLEGNGTGKEEIPAEERARRQSEANAPETKEKETGIDAVEIL